MEINRTFWLFRNPVLNKSFDVLPQTRDDQVSTKIRLVDRNIVCYRIKTIMYLIRRWNYRRRVMV